MFAFLYNKYRRVHRYLYIIICTLCLFYHSDKIVWWYSTYETKTDYHWQLICTTDIWQFVYFFMMCLFYPTIKLCVNIILTQYIFWNIYRHKFRYLHTGIGTSRVFYYNNKIVYWYSTHELKFDALRQFTLDM